MRAVVTAEGTTRNTLSAHWLCVFGEASQGAEWAMDFLDKVKGVDLERIVRAMNSRLKRALSQSDYPLKHQTTR